MCFALLALCGALSASAQTRSSRDFDFDQRVFETVGNDDQIPNGVVTALAQDAQGALWIGTQSGLIRYDGHGYARFRHDRDDPGSIGGDFVFSLAIGADGRVWTGSEVNGVSVLDPATGRFTRFQHVPGHRDGIGPGNIFAIAIAPGGDVFIAADDGLVRHNPQRGRFEPIVLGVEGDLPEPQERVRSLLFDAQGNLWIGTMDGLQRLRRGSTAVEPFLTQGGPSLAGREIVSLMMAGNGSLWVGTRESGAAIVNPDDGTIRWVGTTHAQAAELSRSWINAIAQATPDEVWISRYGSGLAIVDAVSGEVRHLLNEDPSQADGLSFDAAGAMLVDRSGLLWIGSWGGGLQRHNPRNAGFRILRHSVRQTSALTYGNVLSVLERRDGRILVGSTQNGIDIVDRRLGVVGGYRADGRPGALADGVIGGMDEAADGTLWVGTFQSGVQRLAPGSSHFQSYGRAEGLPTLQIESVLVGRDGRVWIGSADGLVRWQRDPDRFVDVLREDGSTVRSIIKGLAEDAEGRLWVASGAGLLLLEPGQERLQQVRHDPAQASSLSSDNVAGALVARDGTLWVNTAEGIDRVRDPAQRPLVFEHVATGDADAPFGSNLMEDDTGRLWSANAILDPQTLRVQRLHRSEGFDVGTNWVGSATRTRDGWLVFGGTQGVAFVDPAHYRPWTHVPEVYVSAVSVDDVTQPAAAASGRIELSPAQSQLGLELASSDLLAPNLVRYDYRLDGKSEWTTLPLERRQIGFGNLWPGEHVLALRARNAMGTESAQPVVFHIRVLPAWWQRPASIIAVAMLLVLLLASIVRRLNARERERTARLQSLVDARTRELREAYERVEVASRTDALTGLGNRRSLEAALPVLSAQALGAQRDPLRRRLALILVDIDEFKQVNDQHGHAAGDRVIEAFARLIHAQLRDGDIGVRWGGEEFLIVAQVADEDQALHCAERLRTAVAGHIFVLDGGVSIRRTCSIGFACLPFASQSRDALAWPHVLEIADAALFEAKHDGRDRAYGYAADGAIEPGFIERFRATPATARRELPLRRLAAS
ncbi:MAG: diguanylate cyclase [Xanthomonadales bacterium]|nr:diguanylate cyclase [Xanthomonadales bacterium]